MSNIFQLSILLFVLCAGKRIYKFQLIYIYFILLQFNVYNLSITYLPNIL